ncbi:MAG: zinc ABC transporter substrate-binding protein, partial [Alphaproteobacteria bacterium]|nr:zinc ABC transporter substrate-binding protein [Alphaproteobacteria bacterium]
AVGSITISPEVKPGAKRLHEMRHKVMDQKAVCVFSEPQFEPALVRTIVRGTDARTGVLDPLGADLGPGKDAYFSLLRNLAKSLRDCLKPSR